MQTNPYDDPNFVGPVQQGTGPSGGQEALAAAAGIVPGLIARLTSGGNSNVPPELQQLLAQQVARNTYQNPLFQAATNQAFMGLPSYATQGLSLGSLPPATISPMGGGAGFGTGLATGGVGGAVLGSLFTNSGALAPWAARAIHALLHTGTASASGATAGSAGSASAASGPGVPVGGATPRPAPGGGQGYGGMFPNTDPFWGDPRGGTGTATLPGVPVGTGAGPGEDPRHD